jgi:dihydrofolate synthase/folylpolyglutamate synthase
VITNISLDHQALLGSTEDKIAGEKAGIIKNGVPVVLGESGSTEQVFKEVAASKNASFVNAEKVITIQDKGLTKEGRRWKVSGSSGIEELVCGLRGKYQGKNIRTVLATLDQIKQQFTVPSGSVQIGIENVVLNTGLYGRWQTLSESPKILCDTGHNEAGIREILESLKEENYKELHWVLGMVNDKDVDKVLSMLPKDATYYFTKASIPRALPETMLAEQGFVYGLKGKTYASVDAALTAAMKESANGDLVFIGGSTFIVGDALAFWKKNFGGL